MTTACLNPFCQSGIAAVGEIPWGSHFCQFYRTADDLRETLVPFFVAGLQANEMCLWVTSEPLRAEAAERALREAVPDYDLYVASGQIEICEFEDWYRKYGSADPRRVLDAWVARHDQAMAAGFAGLRLTGNTFWLERSGWDGFVAYEALVNKAFRDFRIVALCTYSLERCSGEDILDVVRNHQFALTRRAGDWELLESSSLKIAKQHLSKVNEELERRVGERTGELAEALRVRDHFIAMLAHELRNPLAPIRNGIHILRAPNADQYQTRRSIEMMDRQVNHLSHLVDDLLDVSRITGQKMILDMQQHDLVELVRSALDDHRPLVEGNRQMLVARLSSAPLYVRGDSVRLAQVISNLINNAVKFSDPGAMIAVELKGNGAAAQMVIRDSGIGMESELLTRVFEPFVQGDQSLDRARGGLGLGLALVRGLVELHGGTIRAESDGTGQGSAFVVELPLVEPARRAAVRAGMTGATKGLRILIVEDHRDAAESLAMLLKLGGHEVSVAHDGTAGIEMALAQRPEVVLCDIGLPGEHDGYAVARELRGRLPGVKLIAVTGYAQESDVARCREAGFDVHLSKPIHPPGLEALLAGM